jgi:hypothetical protein
MRPEGRAPARHARINLEKAVETAKYAKYAKGQGLAKLGLRTFQGRLPRRGAT